MKFLMSTVFLVLLVAVACTQAKDRRQENAEKNDAQKGEPVDNAECVEPAKSIGLVTDPTVTRCVRLPQRKGKDGDLYSFDYHQGVVNCKNSQVLVTLNEKGEKK